MKRVAVLSAALGALLLLLGAALAEYPALSGRVVDAAGILKAETKASLTQKLQALEDKSGIQLVVATVPSLDGQDIAPYAIELARKWGLGEKSKSNGLLLLVAPKEHRVRFEVGDGLEGTMTDVVTKVIISNAIAPRFKQNDFDGGIVRGVDDAITALTTDASDWVKHQPQPRRQSNDSGIAGLLPIIFLLIFVFIVFSSARRGGYGPNVVFIPSGSRGGWSGGGGGWSGGGGGGGFSGGGGSFSGGGASGSW